MVLADPHLLQLVTSSNDSRVPASLLLLPLPLSFIPLPDLTHTFTQLSTTDQTFTTARAGSRWSEDDDEPFAQAGMGMGKNKDRPAPDAKREVDGMYM